MPFYIEYGRSIFNGSSYTYGTKPHAVTAVGSISYAYDANGNMTTRGTQTLSWDVENRLTQVSDSAAPPTQWEQEFGGTYSQGAYSVQQTSDGGFIMVGYTGNVLGVRDIWLVKTDASGNKLWERTFGGSYDDIGWSVQQTSDGGYILVGQKGSFSNSDVWLIKADSSGNQQWDKTFGGSYNDVGYSVQQTSDGGYVIAGRKGISSSNGDVWLIKADSSGNSAWNRTFGGSYDDVGYSVQKTFDGGYVLAGEAYTDAVYKDVYLIRVGPQSQSFVYDGDGHRVKKISGQETVLYINKYYEKNLKTGEVTTHYYLGDREVAYRKGSTIEYLHQDHLGSTVLTTDSSGAVVATMAYFPSGAMRSTSGGLNTDKKFTGQRLDQLELYYYNARYYDATIGRFVSPDTVLGSLTDPQSLNPYTYSLNNPLKYVDPTGNTAVFAVFAVVAIVVAVIISYSSYTTVTDIPIIDEAISAVADALSSAVESAILEVESTVSEVLSEVDSVISDVESAISASASWAYQEVTGFFSNLFSNKLSSAGKMQKEVEKRNDPRTREVDRVEGPHPGQPGSKPHVHYKDGTSSKIDGTVHDPKGGYPNPSNGCREWLKENGWTPPPRP